MNITNVIVVNFLLGIIGCLLFTLGFILLIPGIYMIIWEASSGTALGVFTGFWHYSVSIVSFAEGGLTIGPGLMLILWSRPRQSASK